LALSGLVEQSEQSYSSIQNFTRKILNLNTNILLVTNISLVTNILLVTNIILLICYNGFPLNVIFNKINIRLKKLFNFKLNSNKQNKQNIDNNKSVKYTERKYIYLFHI